MRLYLTFEDEILFGTTAEAMKKAFPAFNEEVDQFIVDMYGYGGPSFMKAFDGETIKEIEAKAKAYYIDMERKNGSFEGNPAYEQLMNEMVIDEDAVGILWNQDQDMYRTSVKVWYINGDVEMSIRSAEEIMKREADLKEPLLVQ